MSHKAELKDYIADTKDIFTTVRGKELNEEYYCCFGCKKTLKEKQKMRDHMKASDECRTKHEVFLKDIGVERQVSNTEESKRIKELVRENEALREHCKEMEDSSIFSARIKTLEHDLYLANSQIRRFEEFWSMLPVVMKPELRDYCEKWIKDYRANQSAIIPGALRHTRRQKYLHILQNCPTLQAYLMPSYSFLMNQHCMNGEYTSMLNAYFTNLDYRPADHPTGAWENLPPLPDYTEKDNEELLKLMSGNMESFTQTSAVSNVKRKPKQTSC